MRRREFIVGLGGAVAAWPWRVRAQQLATRVVGFLNVGSAATRHHLIGAFLQGLNAGGYYDGQNVRIEYRWADERPERLPELAADLAQRQVNVIVTPGTTTSSGSALSAARIATTKIPVIFATSEDPVKNGIVASMNRPGGSVTGIHYLSTALSEKRLGLLRELLPSATRVAVLVNPHNQNTQSAIDEVQTAADRLGFKAEFVPAGTKDEIEGKFRVLLQSRPEAFSLIADPLFFGQRMKIAALVNNSRIPSIYTSREYVEAGGLTSYGTDLASVYRRVGEYTSRILNGDSPAELPVEQSSKFEFLINLQSMKALPFDIPPMLLARADEVVE